MTYKTKLKLSEIATSTLLIIVLVSCLAVARCDAQQKQEAGGRKQEAVDSSTPLPPSPPPLFKEPSFWAMLGGAALDIGSSVMVIDGKRFVERNPLWRRRDGRFAWERNLGFTAAIGVVEWQIWKRHRTLGCALMIANGILRGIIGAHNLRLKR